MPRTDFSDEQRAEIFVLDRATCSYSGRSLWIADYGIDPNYAIDWADHLIPSSRGGKSTVENGATASWLYNYLRGSNRQRLLLFNRGFPTSDHTVHIGVIDRAIAGRLRKFRRLHISDWFLNRAMWHIWIGMALEHERRQGYKRSRDYSYYARAGFNSLTKWRRLVERDSVASLEQRRLCPRAPEPDQSHMLEIRLATSELSLRRMMKELFPLYHAAASAVFSLSEADTAKQVEAALRKIQSDKVMPCRIRTRLMQYAISLNSLV